MNVSRFGESVREFVMSFFLFEREKSDRRGFLLTVTFSRRGRGEREREGFSYAG